MSTADLLLLAVVVVGAVCMVMGFILVARGIGAADSESSIKLIGVEIRVSRVGPGVLFAIMGAVLIGQAVTRLPGETPKPVDKPVVAEIEKAKPPIDPPIEVARGEVRPPPPVVEERAAPVADETGPQSQRVSALLQRAAMIERDTTALRNVLNAEAGGGCPGALIGPELFQSCSQQQPMLGMMLQQKGPIQNTEYLGMQPSPYGPMNAYRVDFANVSMDWLIRIGNDGRVLTLWSQSP